jgi:hypothetical protein
LKFSLIRITVLYDTIRLDPLPLEVVVAHDGLTMRQDSVVLARKSALRAPNVCQIAFCLHVFVLRDVQAAASDDYLVLEIANVLDRVIFLANNLPDE